MQTYDEKYILSKAKESFFSSESPVFTVNGLFVFPGFCDVHVHFREPGFSYKETVRTGTGAAARGGYTAVCAMPNLSPVPDSPETLQLEQDIISRDAVIPVYPYAAITRGRKGSEITDFASLKGAVAFSDDGSGVQSDEVMLRAMHLAARENKLLAAHCEVEALLEGGCIHKGEYARGHGFKGISSESEYAMIERDIRLLEKTGCAYHVCHVSTAESIRLIREAKGRGLNITCETAPHYLVLNDSMLKDEGCFKMNPPIRSEADRQALLEAVCDGTVDMIATDHAPHSAEEKSKGLEGSAFGITGLETAFPVLYTKLVKEGIISLEKLIELLAFNPRRRFKIPYDGSFTVWDLNEEYEIDPSKFKSKGKSTPFLGLRVSGKCLGTYIGGKAVFRAE